MFFPSILYTVVWIVVYAGRRFPGSASMMSRIEHSPLAHKTSMIWNSSFVNLGAGIRSPIGVGNTTIAIVGRQGADYRRRCGSSGDLKALPGGSELRESTKGQTLR